MPTFHADDYLGVLEGTCQEPAEASNPLILKFNSNAKLMHAKVPFSKIEVRRLTPASNQRYRFKITCTDGRFWDQKIRMDSAANPAMTHDHTDEWRPSEFLLIVPIRKAVTDLIQSIKLTKLELVVNP